MKVLIVNASPKGNSGGTYLFLSQTKLALEEEGIETVVYNLGAKPINDCIACGACRNTGKCIFDDCVNEFSAMAQDADGFIFASPVYYAHPNARILAFLDRVFYSRSGALAYKPAAGINISRRAGGVSSMDVINKYMTINHMPVVSANYWNEPHGDNEKEFNIDQEGQRTCYNLGKNMAWLLKCIELGKQNGIYHPVAKRAHTNFTDR